MVEIKVSDIGDYKDVDVIEVMVKADDAVTVDQALTTLETDKTTMDVPLDVAGKIVEVKTKVGDKVSQGTVIIMAEAGAAAAPVPAQASAPAATLAVTPAAPASAPQASKHTGGANIECEMFVLGPDPGGYSAAFRSADLGMSTMLAERFSMLDGVCLNAGCIPSKALLHTAAVMEEVKAMITHNIVYSEPAVDINQLRRHKEFVIGRLTGGLAGMAKVRKVQVVRGVGVFLDPGHLKMQLAGGDDKAAMGEKKVIHFTRAIIVVGSEAVKLSFIPEDPCIVGSTGALESCEMSAKMPAIGGGIIGLEMAAVYSMLGARIDVVEMLDGLMQGADRNLVKVWDKMNKGHFDKVMLKTRTTGVEAKSDGIYVKFEGEAAPAEPQRYDTVLVAVSRVSNGKHIGAEKADVAVTDRGFIDVDKQQRMNVPYIFAIGDIVGQPMLAHRAVHKGHVTAEAMHGEKVYFGTKQIPSVAYTDLEVVWAGLTEEQCKVQGIRYGKGAFPWAALGRAIANGHDEGFTKLILDEETHRIISGGIVGTYAGDLIGETCPAIEMGADAMGIGKTVHPYPTLGEPVGMAAEIYEGVRTDVLLARKR